MQFSLTNQAPPGQRSECLVLPVFASRELSAAAQAAEAQTPPMMTSTKRKKGSACRVIRWPRWLAGCECTLAPAEL